MSALNSVVRASWEVAVRKQPEEINYSEGAGALLLFLVSAGLWIMLGTFALAIGNYAWQQGILSTTAAEVVASFLEMTVTGGILVFSTLYSVTGVKLFLRFYSDREVSGR